MRPNQLRAPVSCAVKLPSGFPTNSKPPNSSTSIHEEVIKNIGFNPNPLDQSLSIVDQQDELISAMPMLDSEKESSSSSSDSEENIQNRYEYYRTSEKMKLAQCLDPLIDPDQLNDPMTDLWLFKMPSTLDISSLNNLKYQIGTNLDLKEKGCYDMVEGNVLESDSILNIWPSSVEGKWLLGKPFRKIIHLLLSPTSSTHDILPTLQESSIVEISSPIAMTDLDVKVEKLEKKENPGAEAKVGAKDHDPSSRKHKKKRDYPSYPNADPSSHIKYPKVSYPGTNPAEEGLERKKKSKKKKSH